MLPSAFTTRPINTLSINILFATLTLSCKAASNSNLAETNFGIAGIAKVKVRGLVPELKPMNGVAMKSLVVNMNRKPYPRGSDLIIQR